MGQLYARIFLQILDSSLADDWQTRHVFEDLLKLASSEGVVDMTHTAISRRTNVPLDIVERAISSLESPDPISRDPQEGGRRIVRLDAHRTWGWRIVNFDRYEAIRKQQDVREAERVKKAASRARSTSPCIPSEKEKTDPTTTTDTTTDTEGPRQVATCPGHVRDKVTAEEIYMAYPKKVAKAFALKSIEKAMNNIDPLKLLEATRSYAIARVGQDHQFTPNPATWFNGARYLDDPTTWRHASVRPEGNQTVEPIQAKLL